MTMSFDHDRDPDDLPDVELRRAWWAGYEVGYEDGNVDADADRERAEVAADLDRCEQRLRPPG